MIRDGKIKENTLIEVSGGVRAHYPYVKVYGNKRLFWEDDDGKCSVVTSDELLEYTFEIIEEIEKPKEIKLLDIKCENGITNNCYLLNENGTKCFLTKHSKMIAEQQNKIAKAVNYLLNKEENK